MSFMSHTKSPFYISVKCITRRWYQNICGTYFVKLSWTSNLFICVYVNITLLVLKSEHSEITRSAQLLWMPYPLASPSHQLKWHWPYRINGSMSSTRQISQWRESIYTSIFPQISPTKQGLKHRARGVASILQQGRLNQGYIWFKHG